MSSAQIIFARGKPSLRDQFDSVAIACDSGSGAPLWRITTSLTDRSAEFESDDRELLDHLFMMFGGTEPVIGSIGGHAALNASIRSTVDAQFGSLKIHTTDGLPLDGREFEFAVGVTGPFDRIENAGGRWTTIAFQGDPLPLFAIAPDRVLFRMRPDWRKAVAIFLFCRYLRLHEEMIFFHASSIGFGDGAVMFVGDKGSGKSTTSLSLAARGHHFLGDELAAYVPSSGVLVPFRRPVGIKPGPRSKRIEQGMGRARRVVAGEGFVRLAAEELVAVHDIGPQPLRAVVYLRGFEAAPRLERITPGRREMAMLQPILSSFINAPRTQRVFELVKLLSSVEIYELYPGEPDSTAEFLEKAFTS